MPISINDDPRIWQIAHYLTRELFEERRVIRLFKAKPEDPVGLAQCRRVESAIEAMLSVLSREDRADMEREVVHECPQMYAKCRTSFSGHSG